jgi:hypothetical protein
MKSKKFIKPLIIVLLLIGLAVVLIIPTPTDAIELPGFKTTGKYGDTCVCAWWFFPECGCILMFPVE